MGQFCFISGRQVSHFGPRGGRYLIHRGHTVRCAKSRLFSTMVATGPRVLNSAPHAVLNGICMLL